MAAFNYIAIDSKGRRQKGILEGDSSRQIRQQLRERGLTPLEVTSVHETATAGQFKLPKRKRIKIADLALVTRQLATLLAAGLPVEEVLFTVAEQTEKAHVKSIIMGVRSRVLEGHSMAAGMNEFPRAFPELYRATVAAGEQSGHLDAVLVRLADYIEKQYHMQQKIRQALIYPALMTIVAILIVTFLLIFVVPKIVAVFSDTSTSLPTITIILLSISHIIHAYGIYILIALILAGYGWHRLLRKETVRYAAQLWLLKIPVIGETLKTINSARFSRTFGILFAATVPVLDAMRVGCQLITLLPMRAAVEHAIARVREGSSIHQALKATGYFSPMSIHLMASGEASGQLETMLEKTADTQDHNVALLLENSLALFEPLLIIVMGLIVLFIVLAVLLPIFQLNMMTGQS